MTRDEDAPSGPAAWHTLLLRLAGFLPDELITEARTWLAEGNPVDVAQALGLAAAAGRIPVLARDAVLMAAELRAAGEDTELIDTLDRIDESRIPPVSWVFAPVREPDPMARPQPIDLTTDETVGGEAMDDVDRAIRTAAGDGPGTIAVWRTWRSAADGSPWPPPRRVFVVQTGAGATGEDLVALTARLQDVLAGAGEENPQVEVCGSGMPVPDYQSSATAQAALLWAGDAASPVRLARVFDTVDPETGPAFAPDRPMLEDPDEVARLLRYLGSGLPVLTTSATMVDVFAPGLPEEVPLTVRTDGFWVWTDTIAYYLDRYGLAPEPDLLFHLRLAPESAPSVSDVALHRVLSFLHRRDRAEPAWSVPARPARNEPFPPSRP